MSNEHDNYPDNFGQALADALVDMHTGADGATLDWFDARNVDQLVSRVLRALPPIDMVLHCPKCHMQHIDAPEPHMRAAPDGGLILSGDPSWNNPPHRSHLCHGCRHIWRPADVPTNGVHAITTRGKNDN